VPDKPTTPAPAPATADTASPPAPEPRFVRRAQLEPLTGIPTATWATWASRPPSWGAPPMIHLGKTPLYPWPETADWIAENAIEGAGEGGTQ